MEQSDTGADSHDENQGHEHMEVTDQSNGYESSRKGYYRESRSCIKACVMRDEKATISQGTDDTKISNRSKEIQIDHSQDVLRLPNGVDLVTVMRPGHG